MANRAAKTALFDEFARAAKALGTGRRLELLDVLANGERTVEALAGEVALWVANTSQHLQILRQAGLVAIRRQGTSIYYRLAAPEVFELWRALRTLAAGRLAEGARLPPPPPPRRPPAAPRRPGGWRGGAAPPPPTWAGATGWSRSRARSWPVGWRTATTWWCSM